MNTKEIIKEELKRIEVKIKEYEEIYFRAKTTEEEHKALYVIMYYKKLEMVSKYLI